MAELYGQEATYDSIESRFRKIRVLAKKIQDDVEGHGIDLGAIPRGRLQGTETRIGHPPDQPNVKPEQSAAVPSSMVATAGSPASSRKRAAKRDRPRERKKVKKEKDQRKPEVINLCDSDSEGTVDDADMQNSDHVEPVRQEGHRSRVMLQQNRSRLEPVVLITKSEQVCCLSATVLKYATDKVQSATEHYPVPRRVYDTTCDSYTDSGDDHPVDPGFVSGDESDAPLPPGRRTAKSVMNRRYSFGSSSDEPRQFWRGIEGIEMPSSPYASSSPLPSSPTTNRKKTVPASSNAGRPMAKRSNLAQNNTSDDRHIYDFPPSPKLYREPITYQTSTTTSMSNENAPFLPQRTASRSSSSFPTRFSPVPAFRPTTADLEAPEDMIPSNFLEGLDLTTDEKGYPVYETTMPWSPVLYPHQVQKTDPKAGTTRIEPNDANRASSKSTTSKSGSGGSASDVRRSQSFFSTSDAQPQPHTSVNSRQGNTQHQVQPQNQAQQKAKPQPQPRSNVPTDTPTQGPNAKPKKRQLFNPPAWSEMAKRQQNNSSSPSQSRTQPFNQHSSPQQQRPSHLEAKPKSNANNSSNAKPTTKAHAKSNNTPTGTNKTNTNTTTAPTASANKNDDEEGPMSELRRYPHVRRTTKEENPMGLLFPKAAFTDSIHYC